MPDIRIDYYYSDINCPWCIVATYRLDKVLAEHFPSLTAQIRHQPVLLMPDCPKEGLNIPQLLRARYGVTDPKMAFAGPETAARESGLQLDLSKQQFGYPSLAGHTLVRLAEPRGTAHALYKAIISAYFLDAQNTSDPDVLATIASKHGFTFEEAKTAAQSPAELNATRTLTETIAAQGIRSVPRMSFENQTTLNGCPTEQQLISAIRDSISISVDRHCEDGVCLS